MNKTEFFGSLWDAGIQLLECGMQKKIADASAHANRLQVAVGLLTKGGLSSAQVLKSTDKLVATLGIESIKV